MTNEKLAGFVAAILRLEPFRLEEIGFGEVATRVAKAEERG